MRILADVNIEKAIVAWLRSEGHDVAWATELSQSSADDELLHLANETGRIVMTYDKDFGDLAIRKRLPACGIVLLRFAAGLQFERLAILQRHWQSVTEQADGKLIVVSDEKVRVRPLA